MKTLYQTNATASSCCCNLPGGVALIVWFTANGMCVKNNTIIYVAWASNCKRDCEHDLYCCLLPRCESFRAYRSGFPIATMLNVRTSVLLAWWCTRDCFQVIMRFHTFRRFNSFPFKQSLGNFREIVRIDYLQLFFTEGINFHI